MQARNVKKIVPAKNYKKNVKKRKQEIWANDQETRESL